MTDPRRHGAAPLVAVLGGGQLGRMLALAGIPLGFAFRFLDPDPACPAGAVGELVVGPYDDPASLDALAHGASVVTFEFENVPAASLERLADSAPVAPPPRSLAVAQDRVEEKRLFESCGLAAAPWRPVASPAELELALAAVGVPGVLKTRRLGYDGKGQRVVRNAVDAPHAFTSLGRAPCIYEALVPFQRELSILAVRGDGGETAVWPIGENRHRDGILHSTLAPAIVPAALESAMRDGARSVMERLDHRGVLAIEFFEHDGRLLANEMAPRVHNTGHWTIDGAVTSQFENHLRAITGLPLGSTAPRGCAVMVNLIGSLPSIDALVADPGIKAHLYGKSPRPGRKLGHLTVTVADRALALRRLADLEALAPASASAASRS